MRDYALTRATGLEELPGVPVIRRMLSNWRVRRAIARLDQYDDYLLRDIGVAREDVRWAAGLPLTVNAALALEERARTRRRSAAPRA